jgi:hypothetical protein
MINFEMKRIMKTTMNRVLTVCLVLAAATAVADTRNVQRNWEFHTGANPAVSGSGEGRAVLAPGDFASGWIDTDPIFGGAAGIWDLGRRGTIALSDSNALSRTAGQHRKITVRVTQWVDGGIYADFAEVVVPGATLETFDGRMTRLGTIGGWVADETVWIADAGVSTDTVLLTATLNGTLVDEVSVEVSALVLDPPPSLTIRRLAGDANRVEISWSSAASDWVVEASESVTDATGWHVVTDPVAVAGERHTTLIDTAGGARFFRLSKP